MSLIKNEINKILSKLIKDKYSIKEVQPQITMPRDSNIGDFSSPIALQVSKFLKMPPMQIAEDLAKQFNNKTDIIKNITVTKPGFINFFLSDSFFINTIKEIYNDVKSFRTNNFLKNDKTLLEFISANPVGPLNIVSARAGAIGDTLSILLKNSGSYVEKEYFVNDRGNQIDLLARSLLSRYRESLGQSYDMPEAGYHGEYIKDASKKIVKDFGNISEYIDEDFFLVYGPIYFLNLHKQDLEDYGLDFDTFFSEKSLYIENSKYPGPSNIIELMAQKGLIYEKQGKKWFKAINYGDKEDRVILRENNSSTYFFSDILYHINKFKRGFNKLINIWGPDHHGYINRLKGALHGLGYDADALIILIAQQVNLYKTINGKRIKLDMSKRKGQFISMKELVSEVGKDAARYFFIRRSLGSHLDFDIDLAKEESENNPVYYINYAHARICSIFRKIGIAYKDSRHSIFIENLSILPLEAKELLLKLAIYPDLLMEAAISLEPHRLPIYLEELAALFHKYYTNYDIIHQTKKIMQARLMLAEVVRIVIRDGLSILGIESKEKM